MPSARSTISVLKGRLRKLLDPYYADSISDGTFSAEEKRLNAQITSLEEEAARLEEEALEKAQAVERFDQVSELLTSLDLEAIWEHATEAERRTLVEDLVDSVHIYPDHLTVQVAGAPPIVVTLAEVGLRAGTKPVVSEGGREPANAGSCPRWPILSDTCHSLIADTGWPQHCRHGRTNQDGAACGGKP